ncbi:MAG: hypothetical protein H6829_11750 [Planctomycetes bacterium]|nr:hypothetical protein [Planctomycetota bacterium]
MQHPPALGAALTATLVGMAAGATTWASVLPEAMTTLGAGAATRPRIWKPLLAVEQVLVATGVTAFAATSPLQQDLAGLAG